jgi:hypothetical protein
MLIKHVQSPRTLWLAVQRLLPMLSMLLVLSVLLMPQQARAADFGSGVENNAGVIKLWFKANTGVNTTWVNAHFNINGGAQLNVAMSKNTSLGRFETTVNASAGQTLNASFTYDNNGLAYDSPWSASVVPGTSSPTTVATPTFSVPGGSYTSTQNVTVASATAGATVYCSINGGAQSVCLNPLVISQKNVPTTITAVATKTGLANSAQASASYTITDVLPAFTQGVMDGGSFVTLWFAGNPASSWADAHFNLNGTGQQNMRMDWRNGRQELNINVTPGAAVSLAYSFTYMSPTGALDTASFTWTRGGGTGGTVAAPTISPNGGSFSSSQNVTLASATSGASIYYTKDGSTPTTSSTLYGGAFTLAASSTVKAIALKSGMSNSAVSSAAFTITSGCSANCYANGVSEDGATAKIWFAPTWTPTTAIVHYFITSAAGVKGPQKDEALNYNATLARWESVTVSPITSGDVISYFFTYAQASGGNLDSPVFSYTICGDTVSAACPVLVGNPVMSPAGGVYSSAQAVTLSLPTSPAPVAGTVIYYTIDGSAPTTASRKYTGTAITVNSAMTINAIAVQPNQMQSRTASSSYDIKSLCQQQNNCAVPAPTFSHASGTFNTVIGVSLLDSMPGATIHYTLDGSTPTATSPQYYGAIWLSNDPVKGATTVIKAIATKGGQNSAVESRTYTISANGRSTWNGLTTFNIVNGTQGKYTDDKVFYVLIGKDWNTHQYVRADMRGNWIPISMADNTIPVPNRDIPFADYSITLAQAKSLVLAPVESARIYMSVGKPVLMQVNTNILGQIAYAAPGLDNSTDPNLGVTFDFGEFNINQPGTPYQGIYVNTGRVDFFGFPLQLNVTGLDGFNATVGEALTESRDELFARYALEVPAEFRGLSQAPYAPYRIMAPAHASFDNGVDVKTGGQVRTRGANASYLDAYITQVWEQYKTQNLVINLPGWPSFTGRVGSDNVMTFTDSAGSYKIRNKPSTTEVMLGNGVLDDATGTDIGTPAGKLAHDKQLQLQAQVCAALNRHVAEQTFDKWWNGAFFYPTGKAANWFVKFWHEHSLNGLAYGFSYDDVGGFSPSIYTPSPVAVTYTIGK